MPSTEEKLIVIPLRRLSHTFSTTRGDVRVGARARERGWKNKFQADGGGGGGNGGGGTVSKGVVVVDHRGEGIEFASSAVVYWAKQSFNPQYN